MPLLNVIALMLTIIGGVNWGLIAIADIDLVAGIFGSPAAIGSRIVYGLVGLAALYCLTLIPKVNRSY
jgi:uncharacterized membrane protein YuzA (DUF378 family)